MSLKERFLVHPFSDRLKRHPLILSLLELKGNQRACVYLEPLWGIPYNLYSPYATLFMYQLGVRDEQIGLLLSIGMVFQVAASLFGGVWTDKLGRRRTTVIFDCLSWSLPALIWAFSQNFWWFLAAAVFNSLWQVTNNSWNCLLVEDCDPSKLVNIYTWCTVSGLLAVFFAPISGVLVDRFSLVPLMRGLYLFTFVFMTAKFLLLYFLSTETKQGRIRMEQTQNQSILSMLVEYRGVLGMIFRSGRTRTALCLMALLNITSTINTNFFSLYIVGDLGIDEAFVSLFPMLRAAVMLVFIFGVQSRINAMRYRPTMGAALCMFVTAQLLLVFAPSGAGAGTWAMLLCYMLLEAFGSAILMPRRDSLLVLFVDPQERARILGLLYVIMIALTTPFGWISGKLSSVNRFLPFALNALLYLLCLFMILRSKTIREQDRQILQDREKKAGLTA